MKVPLAVFLVLLGCSMVVLGVPAPSEKEPDPSKDVELLPHSTYGDQPIVDTGFGWTSNPFGGLFENIESIMIKMRQQMEEVFKRFPAVYGGNSTTDITFNDGLPDNIDPSKVNTTSVTKIIDGHKVIINDTEYKNSDAHGGSFFHVRVIDVKPNGDELSSSSPEEDSSSKPPATVKDRESIENSLENEIVKDKESPSRKEKRYANLETLDYIDPIDNDIDNNIERISRGWNKPNEARFMNYPQPWFPFGINFPEGSFALQEMRYRQPGFQSLFPQPSLVQNRWQPSTYNYPQGSYPQNRYPQMSFSQQNIYPQTGYLQDRYPQPGYPQNRYPQPNGIQQRFPQSNNPEIRYPLSNGLQNGYSQSNNLQNWTPQSSNQNRFPPTTYRPNAISQDNFPQRLTQTAIPPFDLSKDTYVNDIAAQSGAPINPDAEIFNVNSVPVQNSNDRFRYPR